MERFLAVTVFNTWINSENLGDKIIMKYCNSIINALFPSSIIYELPTHTKLNYRSYRLFSQSRVRFVCGTNLLKSNMNVRKLWDINLMEALLLRDIILVGVGWQTYSGKPNLYTRILLRNILSKQYIHSVRDEYTKNKLEEIGIKNVLLTGCPTLWDSDSISVNGKQKSDTVVFTLTSYNKNQYLDRSFITVLIRNYEKLFFWPQAFDDIEYFESLNIDHSIIMLPPCLSSFDALLDNEIDYVGTRLHAGIHAYNRGRRVFIIGIDNRALEMIPLGLKIVDRNQNDLLEVEINKDYVTNFNILKPSIEKWQKQFEQIQIGESRDSIILETLIRIHKFISKKLHSRFKIKQKN